MMFDGSWDLPTFRSANPKFTVGAFLFPQVTSNPGVVAQSNGSPTEGLAIPSFIPKGDLKMADQFLEFVTSPAEAEIRPVIALSVMLALTGAFVANYDVVYVMTGGGPLNATQVALTYIVQTTFTSDQVGYANAMSMILLVLVAIIGAVQLRFMIGRRETARA
jgi:ABC-type glycerol-3-phosphate transport system substrate-binding protein